MRTTITIRDDLAQQAKEMTGKTRLSQAINQFLEEHINRQKRLEAVRFLMENKPPHDWKKIKAARRSRKWSA